MNERLVEEIANAVLYEGYILYPYRPSALKNRQRFNFGVVAPIDDAIATASGEKSFFQTECLVRADSRSVLNLRVRFLQIVARSVGRLTAAIEERRQELRPRDVSVVDEIEIGGRIDRGWQEAVERDIRFTSPLSELAKGEAGERFRWSSQEEVGPLRSADGDTVAAITRRKEALWGEVTVSGGALAGGLFKITIRVSNVTPATGPNGGGRDGWLMRSLVSTHAILQIERGECLSLIDPPAEAREHVESCTQVGLWPVLVGDRSDRDALLASPIILYDYPQIAPESAGDFCDGTEIDEMLVLRIMTMTDAEKLEMRQGDERGRRMLERTENLSDERMMRLHGVLRGLRSIDGEGVR